MFSIDDHLLRRAKALHSLHKLDDFGGMKSYTNKHKLFSTALDLCRYQDVRYNEIMRLYADYLNTEGSFNEAALGKCWTFQELQGQDSHV